LIAHWSFDTIDAGQIVDQSGHRDHGTLVGARLGEGVRGQGLWLDNNPNQYCDLSACPLANWKNGVLSS
jgi:hypothetical protein